jgi:DNA invertase Pin-like site-specific DNA recombinase
VIVVHTLDRLGRTVRDTLNLIHDLTERGVGVRNLADPIRVDSSRPDGPMALLAVVLLALFAQMERTYALERAAHARSVAATKGRPVGRPSVVDPDRLAYAAHLRDAGAHHRRDRRQDGDHPDHAVPAPVAPSGRAAHRAQPA